MRIILGIFVLGLMAYRFVSDRIQAILYELKPWHAPAFESIIIVLLIFSSLWLLRSSVWQSR